VISCLHRYLFSLSIEFWTALATIHHGKATHIHNWSDDRPSQHNTEPTNSIRRTSSSAELICNVDISNIESLSYLVYHTTMVFTVYEASRSSDREANTTSPNTDTFSSNSRTDSGTQTVHSYSPPSCRPSAKTKTASDIEHRIACGAT
jgi:hypothetical protein